MKTIDTAESSSADSSAADKLSASSSKITINTDPHQQHHHHHHQEMVSLSPRTTTSNKTSLDLDDERTSSRGAPRRLSSAGSQGCCESSSLGCCYKMWEYGGISEAKGYALIAMGRGVAVMSNIVVNAALLELASSAAGCPNSKELEEMEAEGIIPDASSYECTGTVYGQNPLSMISNIAVVTGLLSAFFNPFIGVILDYTTHRKTVGIIFSIVFSIIQGAQIAIGPRTWFPMAILQSIAGFCFSVIIMTTLAYLPEICEKVGQEEHSLFVARFTAKQFICQAMFLILLGACSIGVGISDDSVMTARLSQALNVGLIAVLFSVGWNFMPSRRASRTLPDGIGCCGTILYGLRQNLRTALSIHRDYKKGLRWFMLAEVFAQSSVSALTTVSVVYLSSEVGLNATDITYFFFVVLIGTIPGTKIASIVSKKTNPNFCWVLSMLCLFTTMVIGAFTLGNTPNKYLSLLWGFFVGVVLGWYYPTENLYFSCILPKGQEAEIAGFRIYSSMILSWLPPLIFSILIENGVEAKWGMTFMGSFILVAAIMLAFGAGMGMGRWDEILEESGRSDLMTDCSSGPAADSHVGVDVEASTKK